MGKLYEWIVAKDEFILDHMAQPVVDFVSKNFGVDRLSLAMVSLWLSAVAGCLDVTLTNSHLHLVPNRGNEIQTLIFAPILSLLYMALDKIGEGGGAVPAARLAFLPVRIICVSLSLLSLCSLSAQVLTRMDNEFEIAKSLYSQTSGAIMIFSYYIISCKRGPTQNVKKFDLERLKEIFGGRRAHA